MRSGCLVDSSLALALALALTLALNPNLLDAQRLLGHEQARVGHAALQRRHQAGDRLVHGHTQRSVRRLRRLRLPQRRLRRVGLRVRVGLGLGSGLRLRLGFGFRYLLLRRRREATRAIEARHA